VAFFITHYNSFMLRSLVKALGIGLVSAAIMFFFSLFCALIILLIIGQFTPHRLDLTVSYRIIGVTAGLTAFVLGFGGSIFYDVRRFNRTAAK